MSKQAEQIESARRRYVQVLGTPLESRRFWELQMLVQEARKK